MGAMCCRMGAVRRERMGWCKLLRCRVAVQRVERMVLSVLERSARHHNGYHWITCNSHHGSSGNDPTCSFRNDSCAEQRAMCCRMGAVRRERMGWCKLLRCRAAVQRDECVV